MIVSYAACISAQFFETLQVKCIDVYISAWLPYHTRTIITNLINFLASYLAPLKSVLSEKQSQISEIYQRIFSY